MKRCDDDFTLANTIFRSRLLMGTSRYPSQQTMIEAIKASGAEIVTVSIRRFNGVKSQIEMALNHFLAKGLHILPNTAGCHTAREAILTARLAREALGTSWIKLEVIGDEKTLYPDTNELLKATEELVKEDFVVLPYCNDDPIICQKLADRGCAAVMPLGSPIGSGMGILNPYNLQIIRELIDIPLILDAGIGTASDVVKAMELGFDGVLLNSAVSGAENPVLMAQAMKLACLSGRQAYLSGRISKKRYATASSPLEEMICP